MILHQALDPSSRKELESIMNLAVENTFSLMMQLMRKYNEPLEITREYIRKEQVLEQHLILLLHGFIEIKNHVTPETYHECVKHCHELIETRISSLHAERNDVQEKKRRLSGEHVFGSSYESFVKGRSSPKNHESEVTPRVIISGNPKNAEIYEKDKEIIVNSTKNIETFSGCPEGFNPYFYQGVNGEGHHGCEAMPGRSKPKPKKTDPFNIGL